MRKELYRLFILLLSVSLCLSGTLLHSCLCGDECEHCCMARLQHEAAAPINPPISACCAVPQDEGDKASGVPHSRCCSEQQEIPCQCNIEFPGIPDVKMTVTVALGHSPESRNFAGSIILPENFSDNIPELKAKKDPSYLFPSAHSAPIYLQILSFLC